MHAFIQNLIYFFGFGICHQIPERSFQVGGYYFAVCARDTGTYVGFAASLIAATLQFHGRRIRPADLPPAPVLVLIGLMFLPLVADGLSSYIGLRTTTNLIRYFTGLPAGIAVGMLVAPLLSSIHADAKADLKAFQTAPWVILQILSAAALGGLFYIIYPYLGLLAPGLGIAALLAFVVSLNLLILFGLGRLKRPIRSLADWLRPLLAALLMSLAELALLGLIRFLIFGVNREQASVLEQILRIFSRN